MIGLVVSLIKNNGPLKCLHPQVWILAKSPRGLEGCGKNPQWNLLGSPKRFRRSQPILHLRFGRRNLLPMQLTALVENFSVWIFQSPKLSEKCPKFSKKIPKVTKIPEQKVPKRKSLWKKKTYMYHKYKQKIKSGNKI